MKPTLCFVSMKPSREPFGTDRHSWNLPRIPALLHDLVLPHRVLSVAANWI